MICYKQVEATDDEEYKTAYEIGELYSIKPKSVRYGGGQKISSYIRKYIKENNIIYEVLYKKTSYGIQIIYPKSIYKPAMELYCKLHQNELIKE